jgi:hypothetical protein
LVNNPCDTDGDGTPDYLDLDTDNDGLPDSSERGSTCSSIDNCTPVDSDGNGIPDFRQPQPTLVVTGGFSILSALAGLVIAAGVSYGAIRFTGKKSVKVK